MSTQKKIEIRRQLRAAVQKLNARGLHLASKWACEQLMGMNVEDTDATDAFSVTTKQLPSESLEDVIPANEIYLVYFARSLVTNGEYQRCAYLLRRPSTTGTANPTAHPQQHGANANALTGPSLLTAGTVKSPLGLFLSAYSMYMAGEKLKEQQATVDGLNTGLAFCPIGADRTNAAGGSGGTNGAAAGGSKAASGGKNISSNEQEAMARLKVRWLASFPTLTYLSPPYS